MVGTFSQIYIHVIFAVRNRRNVIHHSWEDELYRYIKGIVKNKGQKLIAINGMPDHVHILIGLKPSCSLSDLIREIKKSSNEFINGKKRIMDKFHWQEGYGAFSYSHSDLNNVAQYIHNQKAHHSKRTFREEYLELMQQFHIDYQEEFLFD